MATQYFRITGYIPKENLTFIVDSYGAFEKLWQFSSFLIQHNCKVVEVNTSDTFMDVNFNKLDNITTKMVVRGAFFGKYDYINQTINGKDYTAIKVGDKIYIPNINQ